jgi:hypothetical protein
VALAIVFGVYLEAGLVGYTDGLLPAMVAGSGFLFHPKRFGLGIFQPLWQPVEVMASTTVALNNQ